MWHHGCYVAVVWHHDLYIIDHAAMQEKTSCKQKKMAANGVTGNACFNDSGVIFNIKYCKISIWKV